MIVALIVARRAPALSSMAGCHEFLFGAGGGRHPSEDMRGARRVAEARTCLSLAYLTRPILANTGVKHETVADVLRVADGCIVGSSLKRDGDTWNSVDPARALDFMDRVRVLRGRM